MKKNIYYQLSDNADLNGIILPLDGCMAWINGEMEGKTEEEVEKIEYTLTPIFLTDEEFENLPEYEV